MSNSSRRYALLSMLGLVASYHASARFNSFLCSDRLPWDAQFLPIELDRFEDLVDDGRIDEQQTPELCWAAAIHALLVYHGVDVTQEQVYAHVKGRVHAADTATIREIIKGLSGAFHGWFLDTGDSRGMVLDLMRRNPVLLGLRAAGDSMGHVVVAYGATYVMFPNGATFIDDVDLWDPAKGAGLKTVSGCDIARDVVFALHAW